MKYKVVSLERAEELLPGMTDSAKQQIESMQGKYFTQVASFMGMITIKDNSGNTHSVPDELLEKTLDEYLDVIDDLDEVISYLTARVSVSMYPDIAGAERDLLRKVVKARRYVESLWLNIDTSNDILNIKARK